MVSLVDRVTASSPALGWHFEVPVDEGRCDVDMGRSGSALNEVELAAKP